MECIPTNLCVFFSLRSQSNAHHTTNLTRIFSCFVSFYLSFFVVFRSACEVHLYLSAAFYYGTILWNLYNLFASIMLQTQTLANALSAFKRRFRKLTTKRRTRKAHKRNAYIVYTTVYIVLLLSLSLWVYIKYTSRQDEFQFALFYKMCTICYKVRVRKSSDRDKYSSGKRRAMMCKYMKWWWYKMKKNYMKMMHHQNLQTLEIDLKLLIRGEYAMPKKPVHLDLNRLMVMVQSNWQKVINRLHGMRKCIAPISIHALHVFGCDFNRFNLLSFPKRPQSIEREKKFLFRMFAST